MKYLFFMIFSACLLPAGAQKKVVDVGKDNVNVMGHYYTIGGTPVSTAKYVRVVEGSPYFEPAWMKGSIALSDSLEYENLWLRLDLVANAVEYKNTKGEELIASAPVKRVTLTDSATGRSWFLVHSSAIRARGPVIAGWYQLLADGKAILYKYASKTITENQPYSSATVEQRIVSPTQYYLLMDSTFSRVRKLKDLTDNLLRDRKELLTAFIDKQKLSGKKESDYAAVVFYYNGVREK